MRFGQHYVGVLPRKNYFTPGYPDWLIDMIFRNVPCIVCVMLLAILAGCAAETDTPLVGSHRALLAQQKGDWEESIEIRKDIIARFPQYTYLPDVHFEQALAYIHLNQDEQAVESFSAAIELDPEFREAIARRSTVNFRLGNYEQAIADSNQVIAMGTEIDFDMGELYLTRGDAFLETGDAGRALHSWELATLLAPQSVTPLLRMASYYSQGEQYEQALTYLDRALKLADDNPDIHYRRALLLAEIDRKQDAQVALELARKLDPQETLKLPASVEELFSLVRKNREGSQEHITARPIPAAESLETAELDQAKKIAREFLQTQGLECLEKPAQSADAILCKENQIELQVLIKIARGEPDQSFTLTDKEYALVTAQSPPLGMVVVSEIRFDPKTGSIDQKSGRVIAFAKSWKPELSRFKPTLYQYQVPGKPQQ